MKSIFYTSILTLAMLPAMGQAEDINGFDPLDSCVEILSNTGGTTDQFMIAAWVFGYLAAKQDDARPVHIENNKVILQNVTKACIESGGSSLLELVDASRKSTGTGSEAEARQMLSQFLQPGADRAALTWKLKPTDADVRAVYAEPLAGRMIENYNAMFTPGTAIGPNEGQTEILTWHATTKQLRDGMPVLDDFPGGYGEVRQYLLGEFPIVRFKFVKPGESLGMAFDGLIHVNGRWVLMPKPWRSLDN